MEGRNGDPDTENGLVDTVGEGKSGMNRDSSTDAYTLYIGAQPFSRVHLCNPTDCSPPGSSVHGILQARILEWASISFSKIAGEKLLYPIHFY